MLELATDEELFELENILFGPRSVVLRFSLILDHFLLSKFCLRIVYLFLWLMNIWKVM